jgi:hypothetical protein
LRVSFSAKKKKKTSGCDGFDRFAEKNPISFPENWPTYKPLKPGANPTIVSYKAGAVKNYNVTGSLMRFGNKNIFFYSRKPLAYYIGTTLALYTIVNSKVWLQEWGKSAPRKVDFVVGNFFN